MRTIWKVLTAGCLCAAFAGGMTSYAEVSRSVHEVTVVTAKGDYSNIAVSQVTDYVNIREQATTSSKIVGKIYNNCAAVIEETVEGEGGTWYRIKSGTVTGYIKAQYFITGEEAEKLAQSIGREFVTVDADGLRLRESPDLNSNILTHLSNGARYVVQGEEGDFFKVEVDADLIGYIAQQYCKTEVEFDQAVSLEEERQKLAEENQRKREAEEAIAALEQVKQVEALQIANASEGSGTGNQNSSTAGQAAGASANTGELIIAANPLESDNSQKTTAPQLQPETKTASANGSSGSITSSAPGGTSSSPSGSTGAGSSAVVTATRNAIVAYAKQFLGNPYVYGGTSLTNGTDCSGFTQGVYAHFGITTGRSSRDQAANGKEIAVSSAQPGDLLFYASGGYINHVAIYLGGGQIIHASTPTTGITIAPYDYRTPCKAVTFLD